MEFPEAILPESREISLFWFQQLGIGCDEDLKSGLAVGLLVGGENPTEPGRVGVDGERIFAVFAAKAGGDQGRPSRAGEERQENRGERKSRWESKHRPVGLAHRQFVDDPGLDVEQIGPMKFENFTVGGQLRSVIFLDVNRSVGGHRQDFQSDSFLQNIRGKALEADFPRAAVIKIVVDQTAADVSAGDVADVIDPQQDVLRVIEPVVGNGDLPNGGRIEIGIGRRLGLSSPTHVQFSRQAGRLDLMDRHINYPGRH